MALNTSEMRSHGTKKAFVHKSYKKSPSSCDTLSKTPVCDTYELHWLTQRVSEIRHLYFSTVSLKPSPFNSYLG